MLVEGTTALCGEYDLHEGQDPNELVCYNAQSKVVTRIPASDIITVAEAGVEGNVQYHVFHVVHDEEEVGKLFENSSSKKPTKEHIPTTLLQLTKVKTLPESFLKDFPVYEFASHSFRKQVLKEKTFVSEQQENTPETHVLLSEKSGTGLARSFYDYVLKPFLETFLELKEGVDFDVHTTCDPLLINYIADNFVLDVLLPSARQGKKRTVLLCSGDGGIVDLLNGHLRQVKRDSTYAAPTISLIPLGTGNALFHSLHRPLVLASPKTMGTPLVNALRTLLNGTSHPLPTFTATFSPGARVLVNESREAMDFPPFPDNASHPNTLYGAVVASYGFHSTLVADSDTIEYRKHGIARFGMVAQELLGDPNGPHAYKCRITATLPPSTTSSIKQNPKNILTNGTTEFGYILCTLLSNLEETFTISPSSTPIDGKLRAICFGNVNGGEVQKIMMGAYQNGQHIENENVTYEVIDGLKVDFEEEGEDWKWRRACIDGQIVAVEKGGWMCIRNGGVGSELLEIMVPAAAGLNV